MPALGTIKYVEGAGQRNALLNPGHKPLPATACHCLPLEPLCLALHVPVWSRSAVSLLAPLAWLAHRHPGPPHTVGPTVNAAAAQTPPPLGQIFPASGGWVGYTPVG